MLILHGKSALSIFRIEKLLHKLRAVVPGIHAVASQYIHFIEAEKTITPEQQTVLERILMYGAHSAVADYKGTDILVVPRIGTISPWASKATDIAHNCGLKNISRIERGILYTIALPQEVQLTEWQKADLSNELHDRMIETCFYELEQAHALFDQHHPKPFNYVHVLEKGISALNKANIELGLALAEDEIVYLEEIEEKTLVLIAEKDSVITMKHTQNLIDAFPPSQMDVKIIEGAGHNTILHDERYYHVLQKFMQAHYSHTK